MGREVNSPDAKCQRFGTSKQFYTGPQLISLAKYRKSVGLPIPVGVGPINGTLQAASPPRPWHRPILADEWHRSKPIVDAGRMDKPQDFGFVEKKTMGFRSGKHWSLKIVPSIPREELSAILREMVKSCSCGFQRCLVWLLMEIIKLI